MKKGLCTLACAVLMMSAMAQKNPFKPNGANHFKDGVSTNWIPGSYTEFSYDSGNQTYTLISKHILDYEGYQLKSDMLLDANGAQALTRTDYEYYNDGGQMATVFDVSGFAEWPLNRNKFKEEISGGFDGYSMYWTYDQGSQAWVIDNYDSTYALNASGSFLGHENYGLFNGDIIKTEYSELVKTGNSATWTFYEFDGAGNFDASFVYQIEYVNGIPTYFVIDEGSGTFIRLTISAWNNVLTFAPKDYNVSISTDGGQTFEFESRETVEIWPNEKIEMRGFVWNGNGWDLETQSITRLNPLNGVYLSTINWDSSQDIYGDSLKSTVDGQGRILEEVEVQFFNDDQDILGKKIYAEHSLDLIEHRKGGQELNVYPNPTQGELQILHAGAQGFSLTDITGKVWPIRASPNGKIDLSPFPGGVYFIRDGEGRSTKIIKLEE